GVRWFVSVGWKGRVPARDTRRIRSRMTVSLNLFAASAQLSQHYVDTTLVDDTHALGRNAQTHETLFRLDPEAMVLQVRQKTTTGFVVCVGNVVPNGRTLTGHLTDSRHTSAL